MLSSSWDGRPFGHNRHEPKRVRSCAPFGGGLGPQLIQCCQGSGLPPHQVASWSIQPFGHNRRGPKIGGCCPIFGGAGSHLTQCVPSNTMWPGSSPTSVPSGILMHPAVWPQQTWATDWRLCPFRGLGPHLVVDQPKWIFKNFCRHRLSIAGIHVRSVTHRTHKKVRMDATPNSVF